VSREIVKQRAQVAFIGIGSDQHGHWCPELGGVSAAAANRVLAGLVDGRMLVKCRMAGHRLDRKSCPHRAAKRPPLTNMSGGLP